MNNSFKYEIMIGLILTIGFMLTATFVFAAEQDPVVRKVNYHVTSNPKYNYKENELELVNKISKKANGVAYELKIKKGNVLLRNKETGLEKIIYDKGDAYRLSAVNYYYDDNEYLLLITSDGKLYANAFKNNECSVYFRKINTSNKVKKLKIVERELRLNKYNDVNLYALDKNGNWELIKL